MASPVLRWAGGKTRVLAHILSRLPSSIDTYYEPFLGGGAVFFALQAANRFKHAVVGDKNAELTNFYATVRDEPEALIAELTDSQYANDESSYLKVRAARPKDPVQRAARFKYLNATCFNGLWRVNKYGDFNVPFGQIANPAVANAPALRHASKALAGVEIVTGDFDWIERRAGVGDAIYADPPYVPTSATSSFTGFVAGGFSTWNQQRLASLVTKVAAAGVAIVTSNSDVPWIRQAYAGHAVHPIVAPRAMAANGTKRQSVVEVVIVGRAPTPVAVGGCAPVGGATLNSSQFGTTQLEDRHEEE